MTDDLPTHERWVNAVGSTFSLTALVDGERPVKIDFVLESVSTLVDDGDFAQWSVVFGGPRDPRCDQGLVTLVHESFGDLLVFVVPIVDRGDAIQYEAVFNVAVPT